MAEQPPPPGMGFTLTDGDPDLDIASTLVTDRSRLRAVDLYVRQISTSYNPFFWQGKLAALQGKSQFALDNDIVREKQASQPPEQYVIKYYVTEPGDAVPLSIIDSYIDSNDEAVTVNGTSTNVPYIRSDNPIGPVNANMQRSIDDSFAMIEAQMPGRFRFERVRDPSQADITFASVPESPAAEGVTSMDTGSILLMQKYYANEYSSDMQHTALHEILHALGLEHPQNYKKGDRGISTDRAGYTDTIMTYRKNDIASTYGLSSAEGLPMSLMPSDIEALLRLYPIAADRRNGATLVAVAAATKAATDGPALLVSADYSVPVQFPTMGIAFRPAPDTANDTLWVAQVDAASVGPFHRTTNDKVEAAYRTEIRQRPGGISITRPYGEGTALLPVQVERIFLSPGAENVFLRGNVEVISEDNLPNRFAELGNYGDLINITGTNNRVSLSVQEMRGSKTGMFLKPGSQTIVTLSDADLLRSHDVLTNLINADWRGMKTPPNLQARWTEGGDGVFHLTMSDGKGSAPIQVDFILEGAEEPQRQIFRRMLNENLGVYTGADWKIVQGQAPAAPPRVPNNAKQVTLGSALAKEGVPMPSYRLTSKREEVTLSGNAAVISPSDNVWVDGNADTVYVSGVNNRIEMSAPADDNPVLTAILCPGSELTLQLNDLTRLSSRSELFGTIAANYTGLHTDPRDVHAVWTRDDKGNYVLTIDDGEGKQEPIRVTVVVGDVPPLQRARFEAMLDGNLYLAYKGDVPGQSTDFAHFSMELDPALRASLTPLPSVVLQADLPAEDPTHGLNAAAGKPARPYGPQV